MATHYQGSEEEIRALGAYVKLVRAAESVTARAGRYIEEAGLTGSQFGALEALYHLGPLNQTEIARKLLKSGGNITLVIDNLEKRELVLRRRDEEDRRVLTVHLTDQGHRMIRELFPRHAAAIAEEMSALTIAEQEDLGRLCRKVGLGRSDL
ncbi:MAG: MarR family transcriptional regulator [Armatimonadetes bacterium]|nr:MarR family transcriptional regulator [Armatimonadota bacterium]